MTKTTAEQYLNDEKMVIAELQRNGRERLEIISKNCGFSRQKVWRIIKKLEEDGRIWGYSAIVGAEGQELQKFMLSLKRTNKGFTEKEVNEIVTTRLKDLKKEVGIEVISSYYLQGEYDMVTIFTAKDLLQAKRFCHELMRKFPKVLGYQLSRILFTVREQYTENPKIMEFKEFL